MAITVKEVYRPKPLTKEELIGRIRRATNDLTEDYLRKIARNVRAQSQKCVAANGGLFE